VITSPKIFCSQKRTPFSMEREKYLNSLGLFSWVQIFWIT